MFGRVTIAIEHTATNKTYGDIKSMNVVIDVISRVLFVIKNFVKNQKWKYINLEHMAFLLDDHIAAFKLYLNNKSCSNSIVSFHKNL